MFYKYDPFPCFAGVAVGICGLFAGAEFNHWVGVDHLTPVIYFLVILGTPLLGLLIGVVLGYVAGCLIGELAQSVLRVIWPSLYRRNEIKRRRRSAVRERIGERARRVAECLGQAGTYSDALLTIEISDRKDVHIWLPIGKEWTLVYEGVLEPGRIYTFYREGRSSMRPDGSGGYTVTTTPGGWESTQESPRWCISAYVPGSWEAHLTSLQRKARLQAKKDDRERRRADRSARKENLAKEAGRFGT